MVTKEQTLWIARFTGGAAGTGALDLNERLEVALANEEVEAREQRELHLAQMRRDVEAIKQDIRDAFHADIELQTGETMKMIHPDQTEAFDWWEDIGKVDMEKLLNEKRDQRMSEAKVKLTLIEQRMQAITFTWSRIVDNNIVRDHVKELFDEPTLTNELYTPLVRELVLPETFVENEFSRVQQMITATNDVYIKELEKVSENAERDERIGLAKDTLTSIADIAAAGVDIGVLEQGKAVTKEAKENAKLIKSYITLTKDVLTTELDLLVKFDDKQERKGIQAALSSMSKSAGFAIAQITGSEEIGKYVTAAMNATSHLDKVVENLQNGESADKVLEAVLKCVEDGFDFAAVPIESSEKEEKPKEKESESKEDSGMSLSEKLALAKIGTMSALTTLLSAKKNDILAACKNGEWGKVRTVMATFVAQGARTGFAAQFPDKIEKTEKGTDKIAEAFGEAAESLAEEGKETEEAEKEAATLEKQSVEKALEEEHRQFNDALELLGQRETLDKAELKTISQLVEKLKRDAAIMKAASTIGEKGFDVASKFLEPLAIGGTLVKFTASLAAAIDRCLAMRKWMESRGEALTAVSPYYTSIESFVKSQKEQFAHKTIVAALQLLQAASQITATAGTGTPVQVVASIVDKGLSMAESLAELTFKYYQQNELESAWKITKRALDNPDNRKANLIARRQNPTLSKYSIAYGAIEAKDVIAISAMNRIGLSRETLAQKDAKVESVKEYLELLYADDIKVKRQYKKPTGWASKLPTPALVPRTWMLSIQIAIDGNQLASGQDPDINRNMKRASQTLEAIDAATKKKEPVTDLIQRGFNDLRELQQSLAAFNPLNSSGESVAELVTLRDQYVGLVTDRAGELSVLATEEDG